MSVERNLIKTPYYSPWFLARNKIACILQFPAILSHIIVYNTYITVHVQCISVYMLNNYTVLSFSPAVYREYARTIPRPFTALYNPYTSSVEVIKDKPGWKLCMILC